MNDVIVVASGKGGTGKSTVCVGLAVALVKQNKRVLLIDCDCGMRGIDLMLDVEEEILFDCSDVICGNCKPRDAVYPSRNLNELHLMAAPFDTDNEISPSVFKQMVDELKSDYDYVIIDSPAGIGSGFATAAAPAESALIVTNAEPTSLRGAVKIRTKLKSLNIDDIRLVINRFDRKQFEQNACYEDLDDVIDVVGVRLIALVPYDGRLSAMFQNGFAGLNWSPAVTVFDCLAKRVSGINVPLAYTG
ncbi:MAG: AAA family ATPase [Ruminococcus sp.]|jgi:septum site-determining protein MinD|nr:AAA family ATPase [Ruminococcus sp.]